MGRGWGRWGYLSIRDRLGNIGRRRERAGERAAGVLREAELVDELHAREEPARRGCRRQPAATQAEQAACRAAWIGSGLGLAHPNLLVRVGVGGGGGVRAGARAGVRVGAVVATCHHGVEHAWASRRGRQRFGRPEDSPNGAEHAGVGRDVTGQVSRHQGVRGTVPRRLHAAPQRAEGGP